MEECQAIEGCLTCCEKCSSISDMYRLVSRVRARTQMKKHGKDRGNSLSKCSNLKKKNCC